MGSGLLEGEAAAPQRRPLPPRPCMRPSSRLGACGYSPHPRALPSSVKRWRMPGASASACMCLHVPAVGTHHASGPPPDGGAMGPDAPGDLRPRQAGRLLEPHRPLGEALGEAVGASAEVDALSRHGASPSHGRPQSPRDGVARPSALQCASRPALPPPPERGRIWPGEAPPRPVSPARPRNGDCPGRRCSQGGPGKSPFLLVGIMPQPRATLRSRATQPPAPGASLCGPRNSRQSPRGPRSSQSPRCR